MLAIDPSATKPSTAAATPSSSASAGLNRGSPNRQSEIIGAGIFWSILLALVSLATWANLDLAGPRAVLFMDEMIPFDNVKRILTAPTGHDAFYALTDGGDHRYGRIFYNLSALGAWGPQRWWGDRGIVIGIRSTQVALLAASACLLCLGLLRAWWARVSALAAIACLPFTDYYLTQPKPEPTQLLFYAAFLLLAVRRQFAFGWHWIFLGLAFGAKISAAPFCAACGLFALGHWALHPVKPVAAGIQAIKAGGAFVAGWIIAVPILAVPNRNHIDTYLGWTFRATGHGSDDSTVTVLTWIKSLLQGTDALRWFVPAWAATGTLAAIAAFSALTFVWRWRRRNFFRAVYESDPGWLLLLLAGVLLLPIMVAVKRIWGFYLYPGEVLAVVALAGLAERWLEEPSLHSGWQRIRAGAIILLAGGFLATGWASGKNAVAQYRSLAQRTRDPAYRRNFAVYESAVSSLHELAHAATRQTGGVLDVLYDPFLFLPDSDGDVRVQVFWTSPGIWDHQTPAVVLSSEWRLGYFLREKPLPPSTSASFEELQTGVEQFAANVETDPRAESTKPYQLVCWFGDQAALVIRRDLVKAWRESHNK